LLNADFREDLARTSVRPLADLPASELDHILTELESEALERLKDGSSVDTIAFERFADLRYAGQEHTVKVPIRPEDLADCGLAPLRARFDGLHEKAYAHALPHLPVEIVNLRLSAIGLTHKPELRDLQSGGNARGRAHKSTRKVYFSGGEAPADCPVYDRALLSPGQRVEAPAIVEEWTSTTLVFPGQQLKVDRYGNLILTTI
jgi:N-methylhydantoinase A